MEAEKNEYLKALERFGIEPNFWCSQEYFDRANWTTKDYMGYVWVVDSDVFRMLPSIRLGDGTVNDTGLNCWAGLQGEGVHGEVNQFLDYNFIYDPKRFLDLSGGAFQVFRKNSRKYPKRYGSGFYTDRYHTVIDEGDVKDLFICWLEGKEGEIHDDEVMLDFLLNGNNRKVLIDDDGKIVGLNVWDENFMYINFRYCICEPGKFLSEYMRLLFYTDPEILAKGKLVNDGGCLGDDNLFRFKEKLNPVKINKVYSWE